MRYETKGAREPKKRPNFCELRQCEVRRITLLRRWVNKGIEKGLRLLCSEGQQVHPNHCFTQAKAPPERGLPRKRGTSLVAQTAGHAHVAEVADEAVA